MVTRREFLAGTGLIAAGTLTAPFSAASALALEPGSDTITVDFGRGTGSLPHFWEKAFGSDRVVVGLRDQWRQDLVRVARDTGMQSVRMHGLFNDEMGIAVFGKDHFNFLYVDQIYDFMLDHGVRPFVELSFMPEVFASSANRIFAYKGNTSPPRNPQDWYSMVRAFTDHCAKRYGAAEVSNWKFEVWNEPNIDFWAGTQDQYFELYRQSVLAVRSVDKRFQVGGPATAQLDWIPAMIQYCTRKDLPIDFASTHVYPSDPQKHIFGKDNLYTLEQVIPEGIKHVQLQIAASSKPTLPLWITEWSSQNPAFIADTIYQCIGHVEALAYWTFSNVFEELGVPTGVFNNTFGLLDQWGIARPSLHMFAFLHKLGEKRLQAFGPPNSSILATQRADGSYAVLLWNLIPEKEKSAVANGDPINSGGGVHKPEGSDKSFHLHLMGLSGQKQVRVSEINSQVGTAIPKWHAMGSPAYPSANQIVQLRTAAELPEPSTQALTLGSSSSFSITLPPNGVVLLEFEK